VSAALRLTQARRSALADIVSELSDTELAEGIKGLSPARALEVAAVDARSRRAVAVSVATWPAHNHDELLALWGSFVRDRDRVGIDALVASLPVDTLQRALPGGGVLVSWEVLEKRASALPDISWLDLVVSGNLYTLQIVAAAADRGEWGRVGMALDCEGIDGDGILAYLARTRKVDKWLAERLEDRFATLLALYGTLHGTLIELEIAGIASSEAAHYLAHSSHPGLRRLAASSGASDTLIRGELLRSEEEYLDGALCSAPLNASEIALLMQRLRRRASVLPEASALFYQGEPLSTKDRLWLVRGNLDLGYKWITGMTNQNPRPGEVALFASSVENVPTGYWSTALLEMGTHSWRRELEETLYSLSGGAVSGAPGEAESGVSASTSSSNSSSALRI
jgi:hypothetical protein